jgi:hypothetical protein
VAKLNRGRAKRLLVVDIIDIIIVLLVVLVQYCVSVKCECQEEFKFYCRRRAFRPHYFPFLIEATYVSFRAYSGARTSDEQVAVAGRTAVPPKVTVMSFCRFCFFSLVYLISYLSCGFRDGRRNTKQSIVFTF